MRTMYKSPQNGLCFPSARTRCFPISSLPSRILPKPSYCCAPLYVPAVRFVRPNCAPDTVCDLKASLFVAGYAASCYKWVRINCDGISIVLYVVIGDLAYQFVFCNYRLWTYTGILGHTYTALIITFLVSPPAIILCTLRIFLLVS